MYLPAWIDLLVFVRVDPIFFIWKPDHTSVKEKRENVIFGQNLTIQAIVYIAGH